MSQGQRNKKTTALPRYQTRTTLCQGR
jgi:hypothetical protein